MLLKIQKLQTFSIKVIASFRVDEHYGSRFETRDKLIKVVLSRPLIRQLNNARLTIHDDSSVHSSSAFESASTL